MGGMSVWHWLVVLLVIVLLFGAKKIPELAKGLGSGIKTFKKELEDDEKKPEDSNNQTHTTIEKKPELQKQEVIEAQVIEQSTQHKQAEKA